MKIALMHFRVYETDGVSLEMDKWRLSFDKMGHETMYISGSPSKGNDVYLKHLDYRSDYNKMIHRNSFEKLEDFNSKEELFKYIEDYSKIIYDDLKEVIETNEIDLLIPNNVSSLGFNISVGIAVAKLAKDQVVDVIYHHHDFHWERERYSNPLFEKIEEYLTDYFPYAQNAKHCVINHIAKKELDRRKNVNATVVPNVFDFDQDSWLVDEYSKDLRQSLGIKDNDVVFLQATRIVERKAIELGYRVLKELNNNLPNKYGKVLYNGNKITKDTKVHFVLAGLNELSDKKYNDLNNLLNDSSIKIHYINDIVDHSRKNNKGKKIYSLWDIYTMCDFITYPSILEGWGNQLLEGLFAKKPMLVYEYPVYKTDIAQFNFDLITIDSELSRDSETLLYSVPSSLTEKKAEEVLNLLIDKDRYYKSVNENFVKAKSNLSYGNLYSILEKLIKESV